MHKLPNNPKLPTIFLPHGGGPCFFMDWPGGKNPFGPLEQWLKQLHSQVAEPIKAILIISGHWEESEFAVTGSAAPGLIFDYHGFPPHTYELTYPAPGSPELAARVQRLLVDFGVPSSIDPERGFDHGTFVPLKVAFPEARIPVVQLSLHRSLDPELHLAIGKALAPLREEGVLIIGSGMGTHNLRGLDGRFLPQLKQFDKWLTEAACHPDATTRNLRLKSWLSAPHARLAHPHEDHLLPLMVAAGAAGDDQGRQVFHDSPMGMTISAYVFEN
ncbi:DODA-type extradiol aromatic ring-opening family dioxygenase [Silvibacterium acidisoli]|uniref:DODA-type extradiol aromatic ring-opening family dioxygenase n=1 Tax=Acidobacteriaceae bacterium ZG23-2 TaxID=2883246 RepID=UPI00406C39A2